MAIICLLYVQLVVLMCAVLTAQSLRFPSPPTQLILHHRQSSSTSTIIPSSPLPYKKPSHQRTFGSTLASLMAIISLNTMMMVSSYPMAASAVSGVNTQQFATHTTAFLTAPTLCPLTHILTITFPYL